MGNNYTNAVIATKLNPMTWRLVATLTTRINVFATLAVAQAAPRLCQLRSSIRWL